MNRTLLNTKNIFTITLIVVTLTILSVWFYGIGKHKTIIENSLISTSILSVGFFLFISIGLYKGLKIKDNIGKITDQFDFKKIEHLKDFTPSDSTPDIGEGIIGIIFSIIFWIIASIIIGYLFFLFGAIIWFTILIFMAMLYWIFFRALRLVFKKSNECNGNLQKSIIYGLAYTLLYNFWIYGIILFAN
ncbi:MAG: hypothetical protein V4548_08175 [Bacteroidota bacterium]